MPTRRIRPPPLGQPDLVPSPRQSTSSKSSVRNVTDESSSTELRVPPESTATQVASSENLSLPRMLCHPQRDFIHPFDFRHSLSCIILSCTVLSCTVLYCTVLYCPVLYCTVLYCTVLYCTVLCYTELICSTSFLLHILLS